MFYYHDSNRCNFDLWSPVSTKHLNTCENADSNQPGYGVWEDTPYRCAIENRAFSPFAKHQTELDEVVEMIAAGGTSFELDDDFGSADLEYIHKELSKRGIYVDLSLF